MRAGNDSDQWSGWRNSSSIGPFTPNPAPDPVASVAVTRADGSLTASWDAVSGATKYHVTYTDNGGQSWKLAALNHAGSSIDISGVDNGKSYTVGVRAGNATGWSGWVNSPAAGPYTPPQPTPTPTPTPEPTPTPTPTPQPPPAAPTGLTATAGDQSVTLAWNDPADSSITGYEYRTRYAGVAWGEWTSIANTTSHTVTGLENGKEYRFKLRAVNAGGTSKPAPQSAPWYVAATPEEPPPPAAPSNVAVNPGEGSLEITWDAVSEATSYDVRAKGEGAAEWHDVANGVTGTSYTYTTSNTMDYVGVRSRNANDVSAWTDASRAPSSDWLTTVTQQTGRGRGASAQSVQAQSQLAAPASITVWRQNVAYDRKIDVSWSAVAGASGYNLACSDQDGWRWWQCGSTTSGSTTQVTVTQNRSGGRLALRFYKVAVRAVTGTPSEASNWKWSANTAPVFEKLRDLTHSRPIGQITLRWKPNFWTTGYNIYCDEFTSRGAVNYTLCATLTGQDDTAAEHSVTISSWTAGGTDYTIDDAKTYQIKIESTNQWGTNHMVAPHIYPDVKLTVSNVGVTTATLTITAHSGDWYYKGNAGPDATCQGPVTAGTKTKDLTGLSANTAYDYAAYNASGCATANELASATRFTTLSSVSNLGSTKSGPSGIRGTTSQAVAFTTGAANTGGYVLKTVTLPLRVNRTDTTTGVTVTLHEMDDSVSSTYSSSSAPKSDAVTGATFSGTAPTDTVAWTDTTYTCSGSGCELDPGKTYFIVAVRGGTTTYQWAYASTETEVALPSNNGWSVGFGHTKALRDWSSYSDWNIAEFVFAHAPSLTSSNVTATGATLTIANHDGAWWYEQGGSGGDNVCHSVAAGTTEVTLSNLTTGTTYVYNAYDQSGCNEGDKIATVNITTP